MKILRSTLLIAAACICMAVILVPVALAAEQGTGGMQGPGGSGPGNNQHQAPPSGGPGNAGAPGGSQGSGNGGQHTSPPSGGMGNMTAPGNGQGGMTGGSGMQGNNTQQHRGPGNMNFDNMTAPDGLTGGSGMQGNMSQQHRGPGNMSVDNMTGEGDMMRNGNMTPPAFTNQTASDRPGMTGGNGMQGNRTMMQGGPGNATATGNGPSALQGGQDQGSPAGGQSTGQAGQQPANDLIADLISRLQALMSGKK